MPITINIGATTPRRSVLSNVARAATAGLLVTLSGLTAHVAQAEISLSSGDTFSTTNEGWRIGNNGVQPAQVSALGPDGQLGYLSHYSDGGGANGKWLMWNDSSKWQGNYPAAGVTGINLWANVSSGTSPVSMRVAFDGPGGWFYSPAHNATAGWSAYSFPLDQAGFTYVTGSGGSGAFADTMTAATRFEILAGAGGISYQNADIIQSGSSVNTIQIDDISAVPEPGVLSLVVVAGIVSAVAISRRRMSGHR